MRIGSLRAALRRLAAAALPPIAAAVTIWVADDPGEASAEPLPQARVVNLRLSGSSGWRADNSFVLYWDFEAPPGAPAIASVHYRVRYQDGREAIAERALPALRQTQTVHLPASGAYLAEVWTEDAGGPSPHASVGLLLDQTPPGPTRPLAPEGWIAGGRAVHLRLSQPGGSMPISGLRGYAVSIDADPAGSPCAEPDRCSDRETDLRGGVADDSLILTELPEGQLFVHAVAVSGSGLHSQQVGSTALKVDETAPTVSISGGPASWVGGPVRLQGNASDTLSGMAPSGAAGPFVELIVDGAAPIVAPGGSVSAIVDGNGIHRVEVRARDAAGNLSPQGNQPPLTATVRIDAEPPRVAFADRLDPTDPERLEAQVADPLSGPDGRRGSIAVRPAGSHQRFAPLPTTVSGNRLLARWSPDARPAGSYEFQATAYDVAGNPATTTLRSNGTRLVLVSAEKTRTSLRAGFGRRLRSAREVRCGRGTTLGGRLATANGVPLGNEEVVVRESFDSGAPAPRARAVRTAADGSFSVPVDAGPSRRIEISFAGSRGRTASTASPLRLEAQGCVTMRASARSARIGGQAVVFSGRVGLPGGIAPPGGVRVQLQFRLPGLPWSEFRTIGSDRHGRFRYPYAFADDDSRGVRFQFRAVVEEIGRAHV